VRRWATISGFALIAAACSAFASHSHSTRKRAPVTALARAQATHEYPSPPARQSAGGGTTTPARAVAEYASAYINWTAATVSSDMGELAARSVGQARSAAALAAAQTANDYELQRGGIANSGEVEAIAPISGKPGQYVVVTRELTTATNTTAYQGLAPAWHVALALACVGLFTRAATFAALRPFLPSWEKRVRLTRLALAESGCEAEGKIDGGRTSRRRGASGDRLFFVKRARAEP